MLWKGVCCDDFRFYIIKYQVICCGLGVYKAFN